MFSLLRLSIGARSTDADADDAGAADGAGAAGAADDDDAAAEAEAAPGAGAGAGMGCLPARRCAVAPLARADAGAGAGADATAGRLPALRPAPAGCACSGVARLRRPASAPEFTVGFAGRFAEALGSAGGRSSPLTVSQLMQLRYIMCVALSCTVLQNCGSHAAREHNTRGSGHGCAYLACPWACVTTAAVVVVVVVVVVVIVVVVIPVAALGAGGSGGSWSRRWRHHCGHHGRCRRLERRRGQRHGRLGDGASRLRNALLPTVQYSR